MTKLKNIGTITAVAIGLLAFTACTDDDSSIDTDAESDSETNEPADLGMCREAMFAVRCRALVSMPHMGPYPDDLDVLRMEYEDLPDVRWGDPTAPDASQYDVLALPVEDAPDECDITCAVTQPSTCFENGNLFCTCGENAPGLYCGPSDAGASCDSFLASSCN